MVIETLIVNVVPLYALILLGFMVAKFVKVDIESIATIMLYAIVPVVMLGATATMKFSKSTLYPPLIIASISIIASTLSYVVASRIWGNDKRVNLIGLLGVSSNATYFGIPIALSIAGPEFLGLYLTMILPLFILDCTLSYYFAVRGNFSVRDSLIRVSRLPIIYGAFIGLSINALGIEFPKIILEYFDRFTGTVIILGMMMIGAALANMERFRLDLSFLTGVAIMRYILWPVLGLIWLCVDVYYFQIFPDVVHTFIILICACPIAANTVAYSARLNLHPALTACVVLITTITAMITIPVFLWLKTIVSG